MNTMQKIWIKSKSWGDFSAEPITVTRTYENQVIYCNHAGAEEESFDDEHHFSDGETVTTRTEYSKCDKCGAYWTSHEPWWHDAPENGAIDE